MKRKTVKYSVYFIAPIIMLVASLTVRAQLIRGRPIRREARYKHGRISRRKFRRPDRIFRDIDIKDDRYLSREEIREFHRKRRGREPSGVKKKRDRPYPDLIVKKYDKKKAWPGNIIFVDKNRERVVEIDLDGKVVWECAPPETDTGFRGRGSRLTDVELLPDNNVLILIGGSGVYELDRKGRVVWSYENKNVSHDADRLKSGNTLIACALAEQSSEFPYDDPQAIEVNPEGKIVWSWSAKKEYAGSGYKDIRSRDAVDWTHLNSVQRLDDGSTLLSVRNWNRIITVDAEGNTVRMTGRGGPSDGEPHCPHTPVLLDNGHIIVCDSVNGSVLEWDPAENRAVWRFPEKDQRQSGTWYFTRAAHRLPNGNTFIIDSLGQFVEVTPAGEIVWQARLPDYEALKPRVDRDIPRKAPFFNADRRGLGYYGGR